MSMAAAMSGTRLAYVVRKLEGTVEREMVEMEKIESGYYPDGRQKYSHQMVKKMKTQPAGNLVYFPRGHVLRLTDKQLKHHGLDKKPQMINLQGLNDPNSLVGQLLMMQDDESRGLAYQELEKQVIQIATVQAGPIQLPEQLEAIKNRARKTAKEAA